MSKVKFFIIGSLGVFEKEYKAPNRRNKHYGHNKQQKIDQKSLKKNIIMEKKLIEISHDEKIEGIEKEVFQNKISEINERIVFSKPQPRLQTKQVYFRVKIIKFGNRIKFRQLCI